MNDNSIVFDETIPLKVNQYHNIDFKALSLDGYFIIHVETIQERTTNDDIVVEIYDQKNYELLLHNKDSVKAGASINRLQTPLTELMVKTYWGAFYFKPQLNENYHFILDNSHSINTSKTIKIKFQWKHEISEMLTYIQTNLESHKWGDLWDMYEKAVNYGNQKNFVSVCETLRKIIIILWTRGCEKINKTDIKIPEGKSIDTKTLENILQQNKIPEHIVSFITRTWSLISELSHIEKNDGKAPSQSNTRLALYSAQSVISYLISIVEIKQK